MLCQRLKFAKRDGFWGSFYGTQWWDNYHIEQIKPGSPLFEELKELATAHVYPTFTSFQYY